MQQQFSFHSGLLYFKDRIFILIEAGLTLDLLCEFHSSPSGGHSGIQATLARLSTTFYWNGMHRDVKNYVNLCEIFQQHNYNTHAPYNLLQPLPTPSQVWEEISI